jgi:hypothetical protein
VRSFAILLVFWASHCKPRFCVVKHVGYKCTVTDCFDSESYYRPYLACVAKLPEYRETDPSAAWSCE